MYFYSLWSIITPLIKVTTQILLISKRVFAKFSSWYQLNFIELIVRKLNLFYFNETK